jgi:hypothetical protein
MQKTNKKQVTSRALLFGGIYCLHPQDQREHQARDQEEAELCLLLAGFLLGLLFNPENGGNMFLQDTSGLLLDHMAVHPRRQYSSYSLM